MIKSTFHYKSPFIFESGEELNGIDICYHHSGNLQSKLPVIWICHALTANSDPTEWWDLLAGEGKLFDPAKYRIICANMLGSCYGTTGPASKGSWGNPLLLNFPPVTVRDIVKAHELLRLELKIESIDLLIGGSIGGFQAVEWSISSPEIIKNLVLIACNARVSPWGTAYNESQRMALMADPSFIEQRSAEGGADGLAAARSIALISYRSYDGYCSTQNEESEDTMFAGRAGSYQRYQGEKLVNRFDAYSYYTLTKSVDSHNVGRGRGGVQQALSLIQAATIVIGIDSDMLFPLIEQKELAEGIKGAKMFIISSRFGHDGFLLEWRQIKQIIENHINL